MGAQQTSPAADMLDEPGADAERDDREPRGVAHRRLIWLIAALLALSLVVLAAVVFSAFTERRQTVVDIDKLPVIRAEPEPYKVQPEQPGGLEIPNRDKLIYGRLRGLEQPARVERLIPQPEQPMPPPLPPRPEAAAPTETIPPSAVEPAATEPAVPAGEPAAAELAEEALPIPKPRPGARVAEASAARPAPPPPPPTEPARPAVVAAAPSPAVAAATRAPAPGAYRLQLAALPTQERASAEWVRLNRQHGELLQGLKPEIARADLGDRIVYRLRVGPIASEQNARALCQTLTGRGVGCLVVPPRG